MSAAADSSNKFIVVDKFAKRQFPASDPKASEGYGGAKFTQVSTDQFEDICNEFIDDVSNGGDKGSVLKPGYAPFCKHIFIPNVGPDGSPLTYAKVNTVPINDSNRHLLKTAYEARTEKELPVLARYFTSDDVPTGDLPDATWLDVILYSREQIKIENEAMGDSDSGETAPWGVVSVKPQTVDKELPMNPITAMRNALGAEHGGSGKPIDRNEYMEAVKFWEQNAIVR